MSEEIIKDSGMRVIVKEEGEGKANKDRSLFKIRYVYRGGRPKTNTREFIIATAKFINKYTPNIKRKNQKLRATIPPHYLHYVYTNKQ